MPKISALLSVYNGERYIEETIESVLNQTFSDFEFIIINDGSTDSTKEIIDRYKDNRIRAFHLEKNVGVGEALRYGVSKVEGEYVVKIDGDDISNLSRFQKQKDFLDNNPSVALVKSLFEYFPHNKEVEQSSGYKYCKNVIEQHKNKVITPEDIKEKLYWFCCIPHTTIMVRSNILKKVNYRPFRICEDYDLFYRMNKAGYKMDTIAEVLVKMRVTGSSTSVREDKNNQCEEIAYEIKKEEIEKLISQNKPIYIWGAGSFGKKVLTVLNKRNIKVTGFIDSNYENLDKEYNNIPILPPKFLKEHKHLSPKIIVASQTGMFEIAEQLEECSYHHLSDYLVYR